MSILRMDHIQPGRLALLRNCPTTHASAADSYSTSDARCERFYSAVAVANSYDTVNVFHINIPVHLFLRKGKSAWTETR